MRYPKELKGNQKAIETYEESLKVEEHIKNGYDVQKALLHQWKEKELKAMDDKHAYELVVAISRASYLRRKAEFSPPILEPHPHS